jgi:hypothetical protein
VNESILLAVAFAVLLGFEWRYRLKSLRLGAAVLALGVWVFAQPVPHRATRRAIAMPPTERVTHIVEGDTLSEYVIGVLTMAQAVSDDAKPGASSRLLALGVLLWLACSPSLYRRAPTQPTGDASAR